uniref:Ganglioside induced differentiation associated protein 1 like 1 n=1 Tax=Rousettus aegyptiacus TaxID=9407 RepID=A0A7J8DGT5_ROUAE|nr:ganglioside induced differentiation associated protein 1 like 1 [Rousettus aegyptiacus]
MLGEREPPLPKPPSFLPLIPGCHGDPQQSDPHQLQLVAHLSAGERCGQACGGPRRAPGSQPRPLAQGEPGSVPLDPVLQLAEGHLANATTDLMKLDHEEEPQLSEPYLSKQKKLMAKILEHDDVSYLKKILGELAMVLDQIEAELEKRKLENEGQKCELWLCGCAFTLADVLLGATLHRLKFLGLSKKYWEDGSRPNLQSFFERVQKRFAFRKVLGDIHTTLLSAVIPNAFRLVKRKPPSFFGASFLMGSLGGMGYFAYWYLKKKYI